ncbi:MAG: hypothetical protein JWO20_3285 [Candidatus Angelobacter sp.]|nr:hypothetical protein [Candidatus Angelobacter sp.]
MEIAANAPSLVPGYINDNNKPMGKAAAPVRMTSVWSPTDQMVLLSKTTK